MKRIYQSLVFIILGATTASAQPIYVVGNIIEEESGEPVPFATIYTRSGKKLGQSNSKGRFEVEVTVRKAILVVKRHGFKEIEIDLSEEPELIDIEIYMESAAVRRRQLDIGRKRKSRGLKQTRTIEELEQFQGMRIDLNDHLRQLDGVSGMEEYSSDISVYGSRTGDVTHYLGQQKIPNIRHLDFGLPGNQSALNPRLLRSITVEDNLSRGPMGQGNASAIQYELKPGDPEKITGDLVFGTFNRELNASTYWGDRTIVASARFLQNTFLSSLGGKYFKLNNENPQPGDCPRDGCKTLEDPIDVQSTDFFFGTMYSDTTGYSSKLSLLFVGDDYEIKEDLDPALNNVQAQVVQKGEVQSTFGSYDVANPIDQGEFLFSLGAQTESRKDRQADTSRTNWRDITDTDTRFRNPPYRDDGSNNQTNNEASKWGLYNRSFWDMNKKIMGAKYGLGAETAFKREDREFITETSLNDAQDDVTYIESDIMMRLNWQTQGKKSLDASTGVHVVGKEIPQPLLGLRYSIPLFGEKFTGFSDVSLRQHTDVKGGIEADKIGHYTTSSLGLKGGLNGKWGPWTLSNSYYSRYYHKPLLPEPEVYWNYRELVESDYALVFGVNFNTAWEPSHHFGINLNGSIVQGDYYLDDGGYLAWEANRSLDLVSNLRMVPRKDSLLSVIVTYVVNNDVPLYEYQFDRWNDPATLGLDDSGTRRIRPYSHKPEVSRQRVDARINLDLKSKWRPLESTRFYFQASNIFADFDSGFFSYLGGRNEKQRGWTRLVDEDPARLTPVVIGGLGLFILFGFEMDFFI